MARHVALRHKLGGKENPMNRVYPDGLPPSQRRWAILAQALVITLAVLDGAIANIALPSIATDLHVSPADSIWVINAYQLAITVSLLPVASLGDIYGYRRVYAVGLVMFLIGSAACGLSTSLPMLVAARFAQGFGAAGVMSVNTALVRFIYPRAQLGRGMGINSLVVSVASAAGPSIAAGILSVAHWPVLFLVNIPIGLLALAMNHTLPVTPRGGHRFDALGALLNAATFGLFILAIDGLGHGQSRLLAGGTLIAALAVGTLFVRTQLRQSAPMLPVDLFRIPAFALSVLTSVCSFVAASMAFVAMPFLFESRGLSTADTGLLITPWAVTAAVVAPIAGRLSDRIPAGKLGGFGLVLLAAGLVFVATIPVGTPWWNVVWRMALCGCGFALFQTPNNRLLIASAPRERSGAGSGMLSTARLLGQTMGATFVALVFGLGGAAVTLTAPTAIAIGAGFAALACAVSVLRLRV
jgi:DHA2 family multidrug resistance protein-like MFS transporter